MLEQFEDEVIVVEGAMQNENGKTKLAQHPSHPKTIFFLLLVLSTTNQSSSTPN